MSTENLNQGEAKKKLKDLIDDIKVGMLITALNKTPFDVAPMTRKKVDEEGNIWFLSSKTSSHNQNINKNEEVQLLFSDPSDMEFLNVFGHAEIVTDKNILKEHYDKSTDIWFDGPEDSNLTALKISPKEAYYWDSKSNKYVTLFKLGVAAMTGKNKDVREKGKLNL